MAASQSVGTTTASTCAPETAHGRHLFKIDCYSLYNGLGVGECIHSATFTVGGHDWCLCLYPDGNDGEFRDWVSLFIELKTKNAVVRALYDLRLIDRTTRPPQPVSKLPYPSGIEPREFDTRDDEMAVWGHSDFFGKDEIKKYTADDILLIECNITVIKFKEAELNIGVQVPPSDLLNNLGQFLDSKEGADVSFRVKEEVFPAHKFILATRSPVFKAEFYGPMKDDEQGCCTVVTIEDMQPAVFRGLLHFTYTDSLPSMDDLNADEYEKMVRHLLVAADRYAMERMKLMCESKLCESLRAETVATTLALADQHHCTQLKDSCIEFINSSNRMDDVVASKGYEHLKRACPAIFADIWEKAAKIRKM